MKKSYLDIAHELIEADQPVGRNASELFGHRKPFGSRWRTEAGSVNAKPRTLLRRSLELAPTGLYGVHSKDIFESRHVKASPGGDPELLGIFHGLKPTIRAHIMHGSNGLLDIEIFPDQDEPTVLRTSDLGRMMLVDELLHDQGIQTSNRGMMDDRHALMVTDTVLAKV